MDDEADIFLIDTHAECCGRDDDIVADFVCDPFLLALGTLLCGKAGMIGGCADFLGAEAGS